MVDVFVQLQYFVIFVRIGTSIHVNGNNMLSKRLSIYLFCTALAVAVSSCGNKAEILEREMTTIQTWVDKYNDDNNNYTEIMSGVFSDTMHPVDGQGSPLAERGDSLYVTYELYQFTSGFSSTSTSGLIYTNREARIPNGVNWEVGPLKMVLGQGVLMEGVETALVGSAPGDSVVVVMTSANGYGDKIVQQVPANTPLAWRVKVDKVIK